jgi:hypothetical protein
MITENLTERRFLDAIFRAEIERGAVEIASTLTSTGALSVAEYSLLEHPEIPVALVLNADTDDLERVDARQRTIERILTRAAPTGWHVTLAVPKIDAWVKADPRVREDFESNEATRDNRFNQGVRIGELAKVAPIDREAIARAHPEFRALEEFVERHAPIPQPSA